MSFETIGEKKLEFNEQIAKAEKNEAGTNPVVFDMDYLLETLDCLDSGFEPDDQNTP